MDNPALASAIQPANEICDRRIGCFEWSVGADSAADGWAGAGAGAEAAGGDGADGAASCGGCVCAQANSNPDNSKAVVLLFILYSRRKKIFWSEPLSRWNWFTLSDMVQWQKAVHPL